MVEGVGIARGYAMPRRLLQFIRAHAMITSRRTSFRPGKHGYLACDWMPTGSRVGAWESI